MTKTVVRVVSVATIMFMIGMFLAYYNTSSYGYDNANILSFANDGVKVLDFMIKYDKIALIIQKIKDFVPQFFLTI